MEAIHHYSERGNHMLEIILETKLVGDITGKVFLYRPISVDIAGEKMKLRDFSTTSIQLARHQDGQKTTACSLLLYEERLKMNLN